MFVCNAWGFGWRTMKGQVSIARALTRELIHQSQAGPVVPSASFQLRSRTGFPPRPVVNIG